jgi:peptidoglycan/LPS O-acetylase OafA/YrhL
VYLLHPEAFALLGALRRMAGFEQLPFGLYLLAVWVVSLLLAEVLYRAVERPGMRLRERFGASRSRDLPPAAAP